MGALGWAKFLQDAGGRGVTCLREPAGFKNAGVGEVSGSLESPMRMFEFSRWFNFLYIYILWS